MVMDVPGLTSTVTLAAAFGGKPLVSAAPSRRSYVRYHTFRSHEHASSSNSVYQADALRHSCITDLLNISDVLHDF
jgi:hypothetical protein